MSKEQYEAVQPAPVNGDAGGFQRASDSVLQALNRAFGANLPAQ